ncbi:sigma-54-dependent Fis family transcriptional regulator, partial [Candidatus Fermentibacterales bacterium]|nr:sigma-54-dependent Fis family transcriptional regulator [Candidatus Fermentibacterales bacterium]
RGARSIPDARRAASMAAEQGLALPNALSLLYTARLLLQENDTARAEETLRRVASISDLLGDRHLALLCDLSTARVRPVRKGRSDLRWRAEELGLLSEILETRVVTSEGNVSERDSALAELLDLPSPLKACELASTYGVPSEGRLRSRLVRSFQDLCDALPEEDLEGFRRVNEPLASLAEGSGQPPPEPAYLEKHIETLAEWIRAQATENGPGLEALAGGLGLRHLATSPGGDPDEVMLAESGGVSLYAAGDDIATARMMAPLIIAAVLSTPARSAGPDLPGAPYPELVGRSAAMRDLKRTMMRISPQAVPVLIVGSTGTGKELVARGIHSTGRSASGPFVAVDCGAIPEHLLESELFGARRGAYTDSRHDRQGLLETAEGGTLFLDEIGNMHLSLQAKLLRVLETGTFRRLGDTRERSVAFRLIAATNRDLMSMVADGQFREDLYYRIAVVVLRLPDLTDRIRDIPLLAEHFAGSFTEDAGTGKQEAALRMTRGALEKLAGHSWPGNVRELRNVIHRALVVTGGTGPITESDIALERPRAGAGETVRGESMTNAMAKHARRVLDLAGGNRARAAEMLGVDPKTLRKYLGIYERLEDT